MLEEVARVYPSIQEVPLQSKEQFLKLLSIIEKDDNTVALFLKLSSGFLEIINTPKEMDVSEDSQLVYLGKPLDIEELNSVARNQKAAKR